MGRDGSEFIAVRSDRRRRPQSLNLGHVHLLSPRRTALAVAGGETRRSSRCSATGFRASARFDADLRRGRRGGPRPRHRPATRRPPAGSFFGNPLERRSRPALRRGRVPEPRATPRPREDRALGGCFFPGLNILSVPGCRLPTSWRFTGKGTGATTYTRHDYEGVETDRAEAFDGRGAREALRPAWRAFAGTLTSKPPTIRLTTIPVRRLARRGPGPAHRLRGGLAGGVPAVGHRHRRGDAQGLLWKPTSPTPRRRARPEEGACGRHRRRKRSIAGISRSHRARRTRRAHLTRDGQGGCPPPLGHDGPIHPRGYFPGPMKRPRSASDRLRPGLVEPPTDGLGAQGDHPGDHEPRHDLVSRAR